MTKIIAFLLIILAGCSHSDQPIVSTSFSIQEPSISAPTDGYCYFIPPEGWDLADQSKLSPRVRICFLGKSSKGLLPSVNLAAEEVNISLKSYIDIVKKDCESDPNCRFRDLGEYRTQLGEGRLTEREVQTPAGICRQVQLIAIKDRVAYILTAGALKEEFSDHYKNFEAVLSSLHMTPDLVSSLPAEKQTSLRELIGALQNDFANSQDVELFSQKSWEPFQKKIINDFTEMGPYWQILLLSDVQSKLTRIL